MLGSENFSRKIIEMQKFHLHSCGILIYGCVSRKVINAVFSWASQNSVAMVIVKKLADFNSCVGKAHTKDECV